MLKRLSTYLVRLQATNRISAGLARAAALSNLRRINPADPSSWEFSAFSQNGEDGIIDYLLQNLRTRNRYFVEIGVQEGLECNSAFLAIGKRFSGLMIEGNAKACRRAAKLYGNINLGVECIPAFVTKENVAKVLESSLYKDPDMFSLDIDGNDYYIAQAIMNAGFQPKVFVVEYNSAMGPHEAVTIPYQENFNFISAHPTQLYYGVSISAWRKFFSRCGYSFVTVESNGVNAFFIREDHFESSFVEQIVGSAFNENFYQLRRFKKRWDEQLKEIKGEPLVTIS